MRKVNFQYYESYPTLVEIMFSKGKTTLKNDLRVGVFNFLKEELQRQTEVGTSSGHTTVAGTVMAPKEGENLISGNYVQARSHGEGELGKRWN